MNGRAVKAIIEKDLKVVLQSKAVLIPLIIVPVIMLVVLPAMAAVVPELTNIPGSSLTQMDDLIERMPAGLQAELSGYNQNQKITVLMLVYLLAPMFLIVPLMVASVIAADSFAGEKERKTLEALLYTPTTDRELFVAKLMAAWVPAIAVALGGFVLYGLVANLAAWPVMGRVFFPNLMWIILAFWVAPAVAGLGLGTTVLVSSRVSTFQEAYQMGSVIVMPVVLIMIGQASGVIYFSPWLVLLMGAVFWAMDAGILWFGSRSFRRTELMART